MVPCSSSQHAWSIIVHVAFHVACCFSFKFNSITSPTCCVDSSVEMATVGGCCQPDIHPASPGYISCRMIKKPTTKTDSTKFCRRNIVESNVLSSRVLLRRGWLVIWLDTSCTVATFTVHLAAWVIYLHGKRLHLSRRDSVGPYHACLLILLLQYLGLLFVMQPSGSCASSLAAA